MNLRIEGQNLRFRISKEELEQLWAGKSLRQQTFLPGDILWESVIMPDATLAAPLHLAYAPHGMTVHVNTESAQTLLASLPSREGIDATQLLEENVREEQRALHLWLEVDIRTQKRRAHRSGTD